MGILLALSGLDGSGKTTQAESINKLCKQNGMSSNIIHLKFVESGKYMRKIKKKLQDRIEKSNIKDIKEIRNICSAFLFCEKVEDVIVPSLEDYDVTIVDRYRESAFCYHYLVDGLYPSVKQIYDSLVSPTINIFLDLSPSVCYNRIYVRKSLSIFETQECLEKSYIFYQSIKERFIWVPADQPIEAITQYIFTVLQDVRKQG